MKRFGICVLAVLILIVYSAFATDFKFTFLPSNRFGNSAIL